MSGVQGNVSRPQRLCDAMMLLRSCDGMVMKSCTNRNFVTEGPGVGSQKTQ
jgi:hypothetical protein